MSKPLTARQVDLERGTQKRRELPDGLLPGLYLIVQPSGAKSWAVRSRLGTRTKKYTLGKYPALGLSEARDKARAVLRDLAENRDPRTTNAATAAKVRGDIGEIIEDYIRRYVRPQTRPSTANETSRLLRRDVLPAWRGRELSHISRQDVVLLLDGLAARGVTVGANRVLAALRRMFNWCRERGLLEVSPCDGVKPPATERARDRVLSDFELQYIIMAARSLSWPFGTMVEVLAYTGQRRSEVSGLRWHEISADAARWSIPRERSKNGKVHDVPLASQVQKLIASIPKVPSAGAFIFTTTGHSSISGFSRAKRRLDAEIAKEMNADGHEGMIQPWTLHDLRRTVATGMAKKGVALPVIEKVLNHTSGSFSGIVAVYQRYQFDDEKRQALQLWADHIDSISAKGFVTHV